MTTFLQTTFPEAVVAGANARRHQKRVIMKTTKLAKHRKSKKDDIERGCDRPLSHKRTPTRVSLLSN